MPEHTRHISGAETGAAVHGPTPLWRNRDFLLLWAGQSVSVLGDGVAELAYPLLVFALTHSPLDTGLLGALQVAAFALFSLPGGLLVDRLDRKRTMIFCDAARGLVFLGIVVAALVGHLTLAQVYVSGFVEGALYVVFGLCQTSALPQVVDRSQIAAAFGQTQATGGAAGIVSQALAGVLFSLSQLLPFVVDAVSFIASVGSLALIRTPFQQTRAREVRAPLRTDIVTGLRWLRRHPVLWPVTVLNGLNNLTAASFTIVVIVVAANQHIATALVGLIFSAAAVGSLLGSLLGGRFQPRVRLGIGLPCALILSALFWLVMLAWPGPVALAVAGFGIGAVGPFYGLLILSYRLSETPDELQGRVTSASRMIMSAPQPLGLLLVGAVMQVFGPAAAIALVVATKVFIAAGMASIAAIRAVPSATQRARMIV